MSNKNKLQRFAENETFGNMFQYTFEEVKNGFYLKGRWRKDFFRNNNPVVLELACGKGEYAVGLAQRYPDKNFIGMDIKGARIWQGLVFRRCAECGKNLPPTAKFCPRCGHPADQDKAPWTCAKCGNENLPDALFCNQCGEKHAD